MSPSLPAARTAPEQAPIAPDWAVEVADLSKSFGPRPAVDSLDVRLVRGKITGFVGPNGAGKTTTMRLLLGLVRPEGGHGRILGGDLEDPVSYLERVGALIEGPAFYPGLSGRDNLRGLARLSGRSDRAVDAVLEQVGLAGRAGDHYRRYSLGMKQRLGIAAALLPDPELLLLDEPMNGLDPAGVREIRDLLHRLASAGTTLFVSSHILSEIQIVCDRILLIQDGRARFDGTLAELVAAHRPALIARPENEAELGQLREVAQSAGFAAECRDGVVTVFAPLGWAGELNRRAMAEGITLVELTPADQSLEEAFFELTAAAGAEDRGLE